MKITKTQTQIIVCEIIFIFLGAVVILRNPKPQQQVFESVPAGDISTVTVSSIYSSQKRGYAPADSAEEKKQEKSVTVTFDPKDNIYQNYDSDKVKKSKKYKRTYRRKPVSRNIDLE